MNASNLFFSNIAKAAPRRRYGVYTAVALLLLLAVTAVSFLLSPIGRRWQANQTAVAPAAGVTEIEILADDNLNHVFTPAVTQIEPGTTITWHFRDVDEDGQPVAHNVVFSDQASPVQTSGIFSRTFDQPGTYQYVCTLHPFMEGAVIVTE